MKSAQVSPDSWGSIFGRHVAQEHGREPSDEELVQQWRKVSGTADFGPAFVQFREAALERARGEIQAAEGAGELLSPAEAEHGVAAIRYQLRRAQDPALPMSHRRDSAAIARRDAYALGWWELGREAAALEAELRAGGEGTTVTGDVAHIEERAGGRGR